MSVNRFERKKKILFSVIDMSVNGLKEKKFLFRCRVLYTTFNMDAFVDDLFTEEFPHYDIMLPQAVQMAIMILDHNPYKLEIVLKNTDAKYSHYFIQAALQSHRLSEIRLRIILNTIPMARLIRLDETAYLRYPDTYLEMLGPERAETKAMLLSYKKRAN